MSGRRTTAAPDWERIEQDYRAGLLSVREIAGEHGISHTAIQKRAKREGWERDLSARIKAKADALVAKREVASQVATETSATSATDRAIVEANAEVIANIRLTHRKDIARARKLAMKLLDELESAGALVPDREKLVTAILAATADAGGDMDDATARLKALDKLLELPTRTGTMKMLAETMTKLIALEREAYNLATAAGEGGKSGVEAVRDWLASIDGAGTGLPPHRSAASPT